MTSSDDFLKELSPITETQREIIAMLLHQVHLTDRELDKITLWMSQSPSELEAEHLMSELNQRKVDPIQSGHNYSQTDIKNKLKEI